LAKPDIPKAIRLVGTRMRRSAFLISLFHFYPASSLTI
jgi:hypothetical protein